MLDTGFDGSMYSVIITKVPFYDIGRWARLDRFLIHSHALAYFPPIKVLHLPRTLSDHSPIVLRAVQSVSRTHPFRFMKMWLDHENFKDFVSQVWSNMVYASPLSKLQVKLKFLRKHLKQWNWEVFGNVNRKVQHLD